MQGLGNAPAQATHDARDKPRHAAQQGGKEDAAPHGIHGQQINSPTGKNIKDALGEEVEAGDRAAGD